MSLLAMLGSMSGMVSNIGPGFKTAGKMAIDAFKNLWEWIDNNLIQPFRDFFDWMGGAWDSTKKSAVESWESIKTTFSEMWESIKTTVSELWDSLPNIPEELTWDYYFGEGGVFNWDIDWNGIFKFDVPSWLTWDYYFGNEGVLNWDIDWGAIFSFSLPNWLTMDYYFGNGGIFNWDIDWGNIFSFSLPDWLTWDYYFGDGGIFDWDFSGIASTMSSAFGDIGNTIGDVLKSPINILIDSMNSLFSNVNFSQSIFNPFGDDWEVGLNLSSWEIPKLAQGGIVNGPMLALLGDNKSGKEAVIPLEKAGEMGFGGKGNTFNITVNASGITDRTDKRTLAREIGNMIQQEMARNIGGTTMRGRY